jgi:hypothetical protein
LGNFEIFNIFCKKKWKKLAIKKNTSPNLPVKDSGLPVKKGESRTEMGGQYLETKEVEILKLLILMETANNHSLKLSEVAHMVFFSIYIFLFIVGLEY